MEPVLIAAIALVVVLLLALCVRSQLTPVSPDAVQAKLQALLRSYTGKALAAGSLRVDFPALWPDGPLELSQGPGETSSFLSASCGKLFTAATVLKLAAEKPAERSLDAAIGTILPADVLQGLPHVSGEPGAVTVRQLLSHLSGFPDYFEDTPPRGVTPFIKQANANPDKVWDMRRDGLQFVKDHLQKPVGAPGAKFHYADTNYDLAGLILEAWSGTTLDKAVRAAILDPLELTSTYYHSLEPARLAPFARTLLDNVVVNGTKTLTLDWAGGGLVTSARDLSVFLRALTTGAAGLPSLKEFYNPITPKALAAGLDYGLGVWKLRPGGFFPTMNSLPHGVGVSGVTGAFVYWFEDWDMVISGSLNDQRRSVAHIVMLLKMLGVLSRGHKWAQQQLQQGKQ